MSGKLDSSDKVYMFILDFYYLRVSVHFKLKSSFVEIVNSYSESCFE